MTAPKRTPTASDAALETNGVGRGALAREVQSMLLTLGLRGGYQVAKTIVDLAHEPVGTWRKIGPNRSGHKRPMLQAEAVRIVQKASDRIALVDGDD